MKRLMTSPAMAATLLMLSALGFNIAAGPSPAAMAAAATKFLESLTLEQRQQATFADERTGEDLLREHVRGTPHNH